MLQLLLKPGIAIISRLSLGKKFFVIFLLYLVPVTYIAYYAITKHKVDIEKTEQEINHLEIIKLFRPVLVNTANSRGLSNAFLHGNTGVQTEINQVQNKVDRQLSNINNNTQFKSLGDDNKRTFQNIISQWEQITVASNDLSPIQIFESHSAVITQTHNLIKSIMESGTLFTDSQAHTSFLIKTFVEELPLLIEISGKSRGMGAGIAAKGSFDSDSFIGLSNYYKQLSIIQQKISHSFASASKKHKSLTSVASTHRKLEQKLTEFLNTTNTKMLEPDSILISSDEYFSQGNQVIDLALALYEHTYRELNLSLKQRESDIIFEVWINILSSCFLILGAIYLFASFYKNMLDSISRIEKCVNQVAEGDLTADVQIQSSDEMKNIGTQINRMVENTKSLVTKVHSTTDDLANTASNNCQSATSTNERIEQQNIEVEQVATAMNEMSATVQEVASNAEQTASSTASADRDSKAGYDIVEGTITSIGELATELEDASSSINELQNNVTSIGSVLDVIQGIADQTNLLALNAAIEAARAGESGRGFAVVADEVRTLASKTQESTEEIRQMIDKLKQSASQSVKAMNSGTNKSQQTVDDAHKAGEALKQISESVGHISLMGEQIASAATEQSTVAEEINRSIMSVKDISELTGQSAQGLAKDSQFLNDVAQNLKMLVAHFKV